MSGISFSSTSSEEEDLVDAAMEKSMEVYNLLQIALAEEANRSQPRRRTQIYRNRIDADTRLMNDYFVQHPTYNDIIFRRRFRMHKSLFMRIVATCLRCPRSFNNVQIVQVL